MKISESVENAIGIAGVVALLIIILLAASGCATPVAREPKVVVKEVQVQVPVLRSCVPKDLPGPGAYADDVPGKDAAERFQKAAGANQQRKARLALIEPVLSLCR